MLVCGDQSWVRTDLSRYICTYVGTSMHRHRWSCRYGVLGRTAVSRVQLKELHQLDKVFFAAMDTEIHRVCKVCLPSTVVPVVTDVKDIYSFLEDPY